MNKKAFVLGGTSGLGLATALELSQRGFDVIIAGRSASKLKNALTKLDSLSTGSHRAFVVDASLEQSVGVMRAAIGPRLDCLVVSVGSGTRLDESDLASGFLQGLKINFLPLLNAWEACRSPLAASRGSAVFISSIAGLEDIGAPIEYSLAKSLISPLVKLLSRKEPQVLINAVAPGNILTDNSVWAKRQSDDPSGLDSYLRGNVPLQRLATESEVAVLVADIAANRFPFMTGATSVIDGGQLKCL